MTMLVFVLTTSQWNNCQYVNVSHKNAYCRFTTYLHSLQRSMPKVLVADNHQLQAIVESCSGKVFDT